MERASTKRLLQECVSPSISPSAKRRRMELSLKQKIDLIQDAEKDPKLSKVELSKQYGIGRSTVIDILKKKDSYKEQYELNISGKRKRVEVNSKYSEINNLLHEWFQQARAKNVPLTGTILQDKALKIAKELKFTDFKASNGWFEGWKSRFSIGYFKVCGESASVDENTVEEFQRRLPSLIEGFSPSDIFNCDETGLFFRAIPDKTFATKGSECKGGKLAKERLTVMLCCSMTGEKLKPFVIGKALNPRCFKNVKHSSLPVKWAANKKAWMTSGLFEDWIKDIDSQMRRKRRKIVMFLDNATSHAHLKLSNITLKFFPANTTSKLQPLDLGIIRAFKARYRRHMMESLLVKIDECNHASELCKSITVLDAVFWIAKSWSETKDSTIVSCFKHSGFPLENPNENEPEFPDDDVPLAELIRRLGGEPVNEEQIDDTESELPTEETYTGDWENELIQRHLNKENSENTDNDPDNEPDEHESNVLPGSELTHKQVHEMLCKIKNFALTTDDRYLGQVEELKCMTERTILKQKSEQKQMKIDAYFLK